jgi:WhiB family transcriptional regulator, redox-sensing transcriptional regulator
VPGPRQTRHRRAARKAPSLPLTVSERNDNLTTFAGGHDELWRLHAACADLETDAFFPERGQNLAAAAAKRVCSTCPVARDCLIAALAEGEEFGIWGGAGEPARRRLRRLQAECPHPDRAVVPGCRCRFCTAVATHFRRLRRMVTAEGPEVSYGPGATHGKASTYGRGCRCDDCRLAKYEQMTAAKKRAAGGGAA